MCFADEFQRRQSAEMQENFAKNRERRLKQLAETNSAVRIPRNFSRTPQEIDAWLKHASRARAEHMQREVERRERQTALDLPESYHAGLADDDDEGPSVAVVWAVVAAGLTLVGLGVWML